MILCFLLPSYANAATNNLDVTPQVTEAIVKWRAIKKTKQSDYYGKYKTIDSVTATKENVPMWVTFKGSTKYQKKVDGSLKITYKELEAYVGFKLNKVTSYSTSLKKELKTPGVWKFQVRPVYKKYEVKQREHMWTGTSWKPFGPTKIVYAYKYDHTNRTIKAP